MFKRSVAVMKTKNLTLGFRLEQAFVRFTVAGAAQVKSNGICRKSRHKATSISLLLPVELQHVNHTAGTNS